MLGMRNTIRALYVKKEARTRVVSAMWKEKLAYMKTMSMCVFPKRANVKYVSILAKDYVQEFQDEKGAWRFNCWKEKTDKK